MQIELLMEVARRAAARAQRAFPQLAACKDDVTQNAYLQMLQLMDDAPCENSHQFCAFLYLACYRYIVCGLFDRNDYGFRRGVACVEKFPAEPAISPEVGKAILVRELLDKCDLTALEEAVIEGVFRDGESTSSLARQLHYSQCHVSSVKNGAITKMRSLLHLPPLPKGRQGYRAEYSNSKGARSMRRAAARKAA